MKSQITFEQDVYKGRDNQIVLTLTEDGQAADITSTTKVILTLYPPSNSEVATSPITIDSDTNPSWFDWSSGGGVLKISLGEASIPEETYLVRLVLIDSTTPKGLVWIDPESAVRLRVNFWE